MAPRLSLPALRGAPRVRLVLALALAAPGRESVAQASAPPAASACVPGADTARPSIPSYPAGLGLADSSTELVASPSDPDRLYYRRVLEIVFDSAASGCDVRALLARHRAVIVDGIPSAETYVIEVPDPGASWEDVAREVAGLAEEPGVAWVTPRRAVGELARSD
jgi:hypothetical protein